MNFELQRVVSVWGTPLCGCTVII